MITDLGPQANAVLDHKAIYLSGASRLKKIAYLNSLLCQESQLDQEPVYNDRSVLSELAHTLGHLPRKTRILPLAIASAKGYLTGADAMRVQR